MGARVKGGMKRDGDAEGSEPVYVIKLFNQLCLGNKCAPSVTRTRGRAPGWRIGRSPLADVTTLHVINSAVVKLGKLTHVGKVCTA